MIQINLSDFLELSDFIANIYFSVTSLHLNKIAASIDQHQI